MAASVFDSAMFRDLFGDAEVGTLFTDSADVRAMLLVEGTLAKVQGELGMIPTDSAAAIHRASIEGLVDPSNLSRETGQSAVVVPALVKAFRAEMNAPEHAQYAHWGATSQDIMDTGLVLRLRQVVGIYETRLVSLVKALGALAEAHADLPMAGRTYAQSATPTSFGAVVASWGMPLIRHLERLEQLKPRLLNVSLSGAAGTLSAMGDKGPKVRSGLAKALNLGDPGGSWHSTRDAMAEFSGWMTMLTGSLAKMGEDLILLTQSGVQEVALAQSGGSSTMPQKSNPVLPSLLASLGAHNNALNASVQGAVVHRQQRDGVAWFAEWLALPQMCMATARSLSAAQELATGMQPNADRMLAGIDDGLGLIYAEALSFALTAHMSRPDAQATVKALCKQAQADGISIAKLALEKWPEQNLSGLFSPAAQLGTAPDEAMVFARAAKLH